MGIPNRAQVEGTASAKALNLELASTIRGTTRKPMCLEQSEQKEQ